MDIRIIKESVKKEELQKMAQETFGNLVKAVVDVEQGIMAVGGGMHADEETLLMEQEGAKRENTWGVNLYPGQSGEAFIEFDSMVNLKPGFGNRSREVEDPQIKKKVQDTIEQLVEE